MASISRPLLSIAIPTFNRASLLKISLSKILASLIGFEEFIEIVISNNCSDDTTELVIKEFQKSFPIKYFKNSENIGFNYNYIKLVDDYITGEYCWVLGDDDFLYLNSIKEIIRVLKSNENISFVNINFDFKTLDEILEDVNYEYNSNPISGRLISFNELISNEGVPGNLMLTFISSAIFKTDLIKAIDKSDIEKESWSSFYNCFPHSYFYAKVMKDRVAYVFETPLITAIVHEKVWNSIIWSLYLRFIPELLNHYSKNGFSKKELKNQKLLIIRAGIPYLFLDIFSGFKALKFKFLFFLKFGFNIKFYTILISIIRTKIFN